MSQAIDKVIKIINSVAQDISDGHTIVREIRPRELRAVWINATTNKEYSLGANTLRRITDYDQKDPRLVPVLQFVANQITAIEARSLIERLENLKAFW